MVLFLFIAPVGIVNFESCRWRICVCVFARLPFCHNTLTSISMELNDFFPSYRFYARVCACVFRFSITSFYCLLKFIFLAIFCSRTKTNFFLSAHFYCFVNVNNDATVQHCTFPAIFHCCHSIISMYTMYVPMFFLAFHFIPFHSISYMKKA